MSEHDRPDDAFLDDPAFHALVDARQETIMVQQLARNPIDLPAVTAEIGARILACYEYGPIMGISEPDRFAGKHDMKGGAVLFPHDPLLRDREAVLEGFRLIHRIRDDVRRRSNTLAIFLEEDLFDDDAFAEAMLDVDGWFWNKLPPDKRSRPDFMLRAVRSNQFVFHDIAQECGEHLTREIVTEAVRKNAGMIEHVPDRLLSDDLLTAMLEVPLGGARMPLAALRLQRAHGIPMEQTWANRERTLEAIRQWPANMKVAPGWCLADDECINILANAVRTEPMRLSDLPPLLQCHDTIAYAFAEGLPNQRNAYGWLCDEAKAHPSIVAAVLTLLPDENLYSRLPEHVRRELER